MNIEEIIKRSGKTYTTIQKEARISQKQLYRIRMGTSEPTASVIIRLCDALGCTADELLGRDKETPPGEPGGAETKGKEKDVATKDTL